jgi:hypothetical protein
MFFQGGWWWMVMRCRWCCRALEADPVVGKSEKYECAALLMLQALVMCSGDEQVQRVLFSGGKNPGGSCWSMT